MAPMLILMAVSTEAANASPPDYRVLICAAADAGDLDLARSVAGLAAKVEPGRADDIAELEAQIEKGGNCADDVSVADPAPMPAKTAESAPIVKGSLEFGLGQTSGTTDAANANIAAALEGGKGNWSQRLRATLDYQDIEGIAASERYTASWDLKRNLSNSAFVTGLATFESDRLAGFRARTTQSIGFGAKLGVAPQMMLDLSGGPSWRQVEWVGERRKESQFGARGSAAVNWAIAPGVSFAATGSGIFEAASGTLEGQASLTGKLVGPLATRLQFTARHETRPYPGIDPTTTTSRASIVYNF